jgi:hypothetical protein
MHEYGSGSGQYSRLNSLYVYGSQWHYADFFSFLSTVDIFLISALEPVLTALLNVLFG